MFMDGMKGTNSTRCVNTNSSGIVGVLALPCSGVQRSRLLLNKVVDKKALSYTSTTDTANCSSNGLN